MAEGNESIKTVAVRAGRQPTWKTRPLRAAVRLSVVLCLIYLPGFVFSGKASGWDYAGVLLYVWCYVFAVIGALLLTGGNRLLQAAAILLALAVMAGPMLMLAFTMLLGVAYAVSSAIILLAALGAIGWGRYIYVHIKSHKTAGRAET